MSDVYVKRRIARAVKNPRLALDHGWFQDPEFCVGFFDRCEGLALAYSQEATELARRAVEMAAVNGDPHLTNRACGVLVSAYIERFDLFWAGKTLDLYRRQAVACCRRCRSDFLRREGDFLVECRKPAEALAALRACVEEGEGILDADGVARVLFVRGIGYHHAGRRDQALDDAGRTLLDLSLESPRHFFHDAIAFLAIFNAGGEPRHDEITLGFLDRFDERIRGAAGWQLVRGRKYWAEGHLHARRGDVVRARKRLERGQRKLLAGGYRREVVASAIDVAQLRMRMEEPTDDNVRFARRLLAKCIAERPDLSDDQRRGLREMDLVLARYPENAFEELGRFRRSFVAPVPSGLAERIGCPDA